MKKRKKGGGKGEEWRRSEMPEGAERWARKRARESRHHADGRETSGPRGSTRGSKEDEQGREGERGGPPHLSRRRARNEDERSEIETRERVRRGNRWMGLAAYPANAPSDIAVTLLCDARGVTTGCCRKIRNFGSLIDPALAMVQDSLGFPSNRAIA